jgi:hypothetical protein
MTGKIDYLDAQELAWHILGINEAKENDETEDFDELVERQLFEEYGMDMDQLLKLLNAITPLIEIAESPLTHTLYKGFAVNDCWLLKIPAKS